MTTYKKLTALIAIPFAFIAYTIGFIAGTVQNASKEGYNNMKTTSKQGE